MELERSLPNNLDAERALLGAMLLDSASIYEISERLMRDDFYIDAHRRLFQAITDLAEKGKPTDLVTLQESLLASGQLESAGGIWYISELLDAAPGAFLADYPAILQSHCGIVKEKSIARKLIQLSNRMMADALEGSEHIDMVVERAQEGVLGITHTEGGHHVKYLDESQIEVAQLVERMYNDRSGVTGVPTGFTDLDMMTAGFQPADLVILAARPSVGKTAMALNIAIAAAKKKQQPVLFFSLEMPRVMLTLRMVCCQALISSHKMRTGFMTKDDVRNFMSTYETLMKDVRIGIDEHASTGVPDILSRVRRMNQRPALIIVDYLQLMHYKSDKRIESRNLEVGHITQGLKAIGKETGIPILALSQLNRAPENRKGPDAGRPQLSDLRESGSIEQDADTVLLLYRPEMYTRSDDDAGKAIVSIAKQRNGPTGDVHLAFLKEFTKFENLLVGFST